MNQFDPKTEKFIHFRHQKGNKNSICGDYVLSVREDNKGNIWIGTWADGVTVYNPEKKTYEHFKNNPSDASSLSSNNAWTIFEDSDKNIWIGTYDGGLNLFNPDKNNFTRYMWDGQSYTHEGSNQTGINNNFINALSEDSYGNICISTNGGGLNFFNKKTKAFSHFVPNEKENSISDFNVYCTYEDRNRNLWFGTRKGLNFLDRKTNKFTVYTTADGLPSNLVYGILDDEKGNLWISSIKGLSRFNISSKTFKNFTKEDGLQSEEFREAAYFKSSSGTMYFGGIEGLNQFNPEDLQPLKFQPPLVITNFQVFNKDVPVAANEKDPSPLKINITETEAITLSHDQSVFSFEFASLNYVLPEKKQYAYMMQGFDNGWNYVGKRHTATYTNLDPKNMSLK